MVSEAIPAAKEAEKRIRFKSGSTGVDISNLKSDQENEVAFKSTENLHLNHQLLQIIQLREYVEDLHLLSFVEFRKANFCPKGFVDFLLSIQKIFFYRSFDTMHINTGEFFEDLAFHNAETNF